MHRSPEDFSVRQCVYYMLVVCHILEVFIVCTLSGCIGMYRTFIIIHVQRLLYLSGCPPVYGLVENFLHGNGRNFAVLTFDKHVTKVTGQCFYELSQLRPV